MITLPSARDQAAVEEAVVEAGTPGGAPFESAIGLLANDTDDLSGSLMAARWGAKETPITLEATLARDLPRRLEDCQTRLILEINGVQIQQMQGAKTNFPLAQDAYTSEIVSSSTGSLFYGDDAIKLQMFTQFFGDPPHKLVWHAASLLPYDKNLLEIDEIPGVSLSYFGSGENPGFHAHEPTGAILDRIAANETAGYDYRDTSYNGMKASIPEPLSRLSGAHRVYQASRMPDWLQHRPKPPTVRYHSVRAYHLDPDTGKVDWEIIEPIPYDANTTRIPHAGRNLDIPFDDNSANAQENARKRIVRLALDLARGICAGETLLPACDPLLERLDTFQVVEAREDVDGLSELLWAFRVENFNHLFNGGSGGGAGGGGPASSRRWSTTRPASSKRTA